MISLWLVKTRQKEQIHKLWIVDKEEFKVM